MRFDDNDVSSIYGVDYLRLRDWCLIENYDRPFVNFKLRCNEATVLVTPHPNFIIPRCRYPITDTVFTL